MRLNAQPLALAEAEADHLLVQLPDEHRGGTLEIDLPGGQVMSYELAVGAAKLLEQHVAKCRIRRVDPDPDAWHHLRPLCRKCHDDETAANQPGGWNAPRG